MKTSPKSDIPTTNKEYQCVARLLRYEIRFLWIGLKFFPQKNEDDFLESVATLLLIF